MIMNLISECKKKIEMYLPIIQYKKDGEGAGYVYFITLFEQHVMFYRK